MSSCDVCPSICHTILVFHTKRGGDILTETPYGVSNAGGVGRNCDSEPIYLVRAVNAAASQVLSTELLVERRC